MWTNLFIHVCNIDIYNLPKLFWPLGECWPPWDSWPLRECWPLSQYDTVSKASKKMEIQFSMFMCTYIWFYLYITMWMMDLPWFIWYSLWSTTLISHSSRCMRLYWCPPQIIMWKMLINDMDIYRYIDMHDI